MAGMAEVFQPKLYKNIKQAHTINSQQGNFKLKRFKSGNVNRS